jgi:hypothetical protein
LFCCCCFLYSHFTLEETGARRKDAAVFLLVSRNKAFMLSILLDNLHDLFCSMSIVGVPQQNALPPPPDNGVMTSLPSGVSGATAAARPRIEISNMFVARCCNKKTKSLTEDDAAVFLLSA